MACDDSSAVHETLPTDSGAGPDTGLGDGGQGGDGAPGTDCFTDPKTYEEIINACTDAAKIDKHPVLPNLLADGGLPPLK